MGIKKIFQDSDYFGDITNDIEPKISKLMQNAFIEVNEEGTATDDANDQCK